MRAIEVAVGCNAARYAMVSKFAYRTMRQLAPGPFTFVLEATRLVPEMMTTKQKQVGIRIPSLPWAQAPAPWATGGQQLGGRGGRGGAARSPGHQGFDRTCIGADRRGGGPIHQPSTVVSLVGDEIDVIRQGYGVLAGWEKAFGPS